LKGLKEADTKEFDLPVPEDYPNEEFAGKTAMFSIDVVAVKKKDLPKLTDDLAASLGEEFKTVDELRARISENLEAQAKDGLRRSLEEKIVDALVEGAKFDMSPMIVDHEAEHVLEDQQRQLAQYNIDFQQYMQGIGKSTEEIVSEAKSSAELRLKRSLVIDALTESEATSVTDEEVAAEIALMQEQPQYANENLDTDEARDAVRRILLRRAAMDSVIEITNNPKAAPKSRTKKATSTDKAATVTANPTAKEPAARARAKTPRRVAKTTE